MPLLELHIDPASFIDIEPQGALVEVDGEMVRLPLGKSIYEMMVPNPDPG